MKTLGQIALASLFFALLSLSGFAQSGIITTYVGPSLPVNGSSALTQPIDFPYSVVPDGAGGFYFSSSQNRVYRVSAAGILTLVAGTRTFGFGGDGGPATAAQLASPQGLATDSAGNLYIADTYNARIRKVTAAGVISTVAGNGTWGFLGDGGAAISAELYYPEGVATDAAGNLYIADTGNNRIRKVTPAGVITTVAGGGAGFSGDGGPATSAGLNYPEGLAMDSAGNMYIADTYNQLIRKVTSAGTISTVAGNSTAGFSNDGGAANAAGLAYPEGVAVDSAGNLYIADTDDHRIRKVTPAGIISTVAGDGNYDVYGDWGTKSGVAATSSSLYYPQSVATDANGNLFIADTHDARIRVVTAGIVTNIAGIGLAGFSGDGGLATSALMLGPNGAAIDAAGNLYIADTGNQRVRKVTPAGIISTIAGNGTAGYSGDGGPATSAQLYEPFRVALDSAGNLYIADTDNHRVRKVTPAGIISTVAGNGTAGYSGDGGTATAAKLNTPWGVMVDANGNLFIADSRNAAIRKVTPAGIISTVAGNGTQGYSGDNGAATSAKLDYPEGMALDAAGNLYIADTSNNVIRKVTTAGIITTVVGSGAKGYSGDNGAATSAKLNYPEDVVFDSAGNLYIADTSNNVIRKVTTAGIISTVAGNGVAGFSGDGGSPTAAQLSFPRDLAVDAKGSLFIVDNNNGRIRLSTSYSSTVYFPQVVAGGGYTTIFTITNTGSTTASGIVTLTDQQASPFTVNGTLTDASGTKQPTTTGSYFSFTVPSGGTIFLSVTTSSATAAGWAEIDSTGGTLTAVATYDYTVGSVVQLIVGVLQTQPLQYMTFPVNNDTTKQLDTVYGIANPGSQPISVKLALVGQDGTMVADITKTLNPGTQIATYLYQTFFSGPTNFKGSLVLRGQNGATFVAVALNYKQNLLTVIPLISGKAPGVPNVVVDADDISPSVAYANSVYFPQVAVGGGYTTIFTITNTGSTAASGTVTLTDQQANAFLVNGTLTDSTGTTQPTTTGASFLFTVPSGGTIFLSVTTSSSIKVGWAEIDSTGGTLTAVATYDYTIGSTVQSIVGVLQTQPLQYMTFPVNNESAIQLDTVYGIANPTNGTIYVKLALVAQDGTVVNDITVTLSPGTQIATYLKQSFSGRNDFKGSLVLRGQNGATFVAVALNYKQNLLTVIPLISGKAPGIPN